MSSEDVLPSLEIETLPSGSDNVVVLPWYNRIYNFSCTLFFSSLLYVVPIIVVIEVAITLPSTNVNPDHPLHMVSFCTNCNLLAGTLMSTLDDNALSCISDGVLSEVGDMLRDYFLNYIGSMVGHILIIYALIQSKDGDFIDGTHAKFKYSKKLHKIAYLILFSDIITEIAIIEGLDLVDPTSFIKRLKDGEYDTCDDADITQVSDLKLLLTDVAFTILVFRVCVAICCSLLYVYIPLVEVREEGEGKEDEAKESEAKEVEERNASRPGMFTRMPMSI